MEERARPHFDFALLDPQPGRALQEHDRTVQELPGHNGVRSTMIYAHVSNRGALGVRSPADGLPRRPDERQAETAYHAGQERDNETTD